MRGQSLLVAVAALVTAAVAGAQTPAAAQSYYGDPHCQQQRQNRMAAGALIGGLAGAVLGNNVAADNAQTEGTVLGGVAGAVAGAAIGRATAGCDTADRQRYGYHNNAPHSSYSNNTVHGYSGHGYSGHGYSGHGYSGAGYSGAGYGSSGGGYGYGYGHPPQECRWGEQRVRDRRGRWQTQDVYLCQGADGVWRAQ
jgi:hypothetical protein